jgi:hypothetical protein
LSLKKYPEGTYFLKRNVIRKNSLHLDNEEVKSVIKQKPNRKILGFFRFHLGLYNFGNLGDTIVEGRKGFNKFWAKRKRDLRIIGEEPVFLDSSLTLKSVQQLTIYLQKKGYFNAVVKDSVIIKNRKAKVIYNFYPGIPYTTRAIYYSSRDEGIDSILSRLKN